MATIVERETSAGERRYLVVVRLKGYPAQTATFERKTDAKRWAQDTESAIREGRHFRSAEAKKHTLSELIDKYLEEGFQRKPKSLPKYRQHLEWWRKELGAYTLLDVTPARIRECKLKLSRIETARKAPMSPATVNRYLASLSDCFTDAVKELYWCEANPVRSVAKMKEPKGRDRFLAGEEKDALIAQCRESRTPELIAVVLIALTTGARYSEIMTLRWPDVSLSRGTLTLRNTKNSDTRTIPIVGEVKPLLEERSKVRRLDTDLLFPASKPAVPLEIRRGFELACERAGIENFRFHDLRHTAASYLAMSGATLPEIAAVLGHRTLAMVKRYAHLTEQHTTGVVNRMVEKFYG